MGLYKKREEAAQKVKLPDSFSLKLKTIKASMKHYTIFEQLGAKLADQFDAIADLQLEN